MFDAVFDVFEEADAFGAVDDAVVVAEGDVHHRAQGDLAGVVWVFYCALLDAVHAEDCGLRWVQDWRGHE